MASRTPLRPLNLAARAAARSYRPAPLARGFRTSSPALIKVGDRLPDLNALMETSPGTRVNLAEEADRTTNAIIIGVPAAFSPVCSANHVPSYIRHPALKDYGLVAVVSVNDAFVYVFFIPRVSYARGPGLREVIRLRGL